MSQVDEKLFDKRLVTRNIAKGLITQEQYDKHMKTLADESDVAEWVALELEETEIGSGNSEKESLEDGGDSEFIGSDDESDESVEE